MFVKYAQKLTFLQYTYTIQNTTYLGDFVIKKVIVLLIVINISLFADFYYSGGKKHTLDSLKVQRAVDKNDTISFRTNLGNIVKINNQLIVSFEDNRIKKLIEERYNLKLIESLSDTMYLYQVDDATKTLKIANKIYEQDGVKFSHPNFKVTKKTRAISNDPHADLLWHLEDNSYNGADINIKEAWEYTKGAGVKVAVYDDGIDINHVDLRENIYAYANFNDPTTNIPNPMLDSWHGTATTGILAAKENYRGGVGVAPEVSVYAVGYGDTVAKDIAAYRWLMSEGVSVINNSWGTYEQLDAYSEIFRELATKGRDGKGIIIIFASGNKVDGREKNLDLPNINDESESPFVISVAASTSYNRIASYSNFGKSVDFTAPGGSNANGIFTTDATGANGYNSSDYNYNFMGTSAAAPIVAGVAALMLSVNPELTKNDVVKILKRTAQKLGVYPYDENGHNVYWGYGKVDAASAVKLAIYSRSNLKNFAHTMFKELTQ